MPSLRQLGHSLFVLFLSCSYGSLVYCKTYYVDNSDGGDAKSEIVPRGSHVYPFDTIAGALKVILPGDTLIIAAGTYRESIILPKHIEKDSRSFTIIGSDKTVIKGSDIVVGWRSLGKGLFVKDDWPYNSQQVFVNGRALQQIGGEIYKGYPSDVTHPMHRLHPGKSIWPGRKPFLGIKNLPDNSFFYQVRQKKLFVKYGENSSLLNELVEVSVRPYLFFSRDWDHIIVENIHFTHSNTSDSSRHGAVSVWGNNATLEKLIITDVDSIGLHVKGDSNQIKFCQALSNGRLGFAVKGKRNFLYGNITNANNTRGFNKHWEAGGVKFVGDGGLQDSNMLNHQAFYNVGDGVWFDWGNKNNLVCGNDIGYNSGHGIHYEASYGAHILNNRIYANGQRGIYLPHSSSSQVFSNLIAFNALSGIVIIDQGRIDPKGLLNLRASNNRVFGNIVAWNAGIADIILPGNRMDNLSSHNLIITEKSAPYFSFGWPKPLSLTKGLKAWETRSGQEVNSKHISKAIPDIYRVKIDTKKPIVDWSLLLGMWRKSMITDDIGANNLQDHAEKLLLHNVECNQLL